MPRRQQNGRTRARTSSQVDLQVTEDETIITATTTTTTTSVSLQTPISVSHPPLNDHTMYLPNPDLLNLLKKVGASGRESTKGELFTFKQLGFFMKEYIKTRQLYDVKNQAVAHCKDDPLGLVLGVSSFTNQDANNLLKRHIRRVDTSKLFKTNTGVDLSKEVQDNSGRIEQNDIVTSTVNDNISDTTSCHDKDAPLPSRISNAASSASDPVQKAAGTELEHRSSSILPQELEAETSQTSTVAQPHSGRHGVKRKRTHRESASSEGRGEERSSRRRSPSFSLVIDDWAPQGSAYYECWQYLMPLIPSSDESEILSIQSKETMLVRSSSDDPWTSDDEPYQLVYRTIDPPFEVEYDIGSDHGSGSGGNSATDNESDSTQILEGEVYLVCRESDMEWWADSESSDSDSDFSSDADLAEEDKWKCEKCGNTNSPIRSWCDCCMVVRPDWLPPLRTAAQRRHREHRSEGQGCTSSGEDECDGPIGEADNTGEVLQQGTNNTPSQGLSLQEFPSPVDVHRLQTQETATDSGLDLGLSQGSSSLTPAGSQDSGVHLEGDPGGFDCSTPIQNSTRVAGGNRLQSLRQNPTDPLPTTTNKASTRVDNSELRKTKSLDSVQPDKDPTAVCRVCYNNPKDASIIHGNTGHQVCCYRCAKKLRRRGKPCPVCRKRIQKVIRNFIV